MGLDGWSSSVSCLLENVSEFGNCHIYILLCFEFPFAIYLVAYLRFISVLISTRVMESGRWSVDHEHGAECGYDRGMA
jgi:hypothetical protein